MSGEGCPWQCFVKPLSSAYRHASILRGAGRVPLVPQPCPHDARHQLVVWGPSLEDCSCTPFHRAAGDPAPWSALTWVPPSRDKGQMQAPRVVWGTQGSLPFLHEVGGDSSSC